LEQLIQHQDTAKVCTVWYKRVQQSVIFYCSVAFRTTPMDSTGVSHILEHTVLTGSRRYPCRDPFFKMLNRSLNTFMNAFTCKYIMHACMPLYVHVYIKCIGIYSAWVADIVVPAGMHILSITLINKPNKSTNHKSILFTYYVHSFKSFNFIPRISIFYKQMKIV